MHLLQLCFGLAEQGHRTARRLVRGDELSGELLVAHLESSPELVTRRLELRTRRTELGPQCRLRPRRLRHGRLRLDTRRLERLSALRLRLDTRRLERLSALRLALQIELREIERRLERLSALRLAL